jgi:hypothetical protein
VGRAGVYHRLVTGPVYTRRHASNKNVAESALVHFGMKKETGKRNSN